MKRVLCLLLMLATTAMLGCVHFGKCPTCSPCATSATAPPKHVRASWSAGNGRFFYAGGTNGTYTVPGGAFVTGISAHATGGGATLTMTPAGPDVTSPVTGPAIPIPAGAALSLSRPLLTGNSDELGVGSVLVFTNTDAYIVTLFQGGGP